jgi:hypothetical protein
MRERPDNSATRAPQVDPSECFAEFEVPDEPARGCTDDSGGEEDDTVQVTVVLRGRRTELENPALALAQLAMRTIHTSGTDGENNNARDQGDVIDSVGIAVEPAWAR